MWQCHTVTALWRCSSDVVTVTVTVMTHYDDGQQGLALVQRQRETARCARRNYLHFTPIWALARSSDP